MRFCPYCSTGLVLQIRRGGERKVCPACGFIDRKNPTPVVAAIVEHEGQIILARNASWSVPFFALVTGFLEADDLSPEDAVCREVAEELGLRTIGAPNFVGFYPYREKNQLVMAFHVLAEGEIVLSDELSAYQRVDFAAATYWPAVTGFALKDWLNSKGYFPGECPLPDL